MKSYDRRSFIKAGAAVAAGSFALPQFFIGKAGAAANSKLNVAMIGCGNIANMSLDGCKNENIVAICDVDSNMLYKHARKYPKIREAKTFTDFRVMLDKMGDQIDAVCISTPDHTHFVATIASMERGKHVFTQKPLTHNIWQARTLRKAMHKYNVITNMGNQGHTYDGIRKLREWYEADVFGQITEAHSWISGPKWGGTYFPKKPTSYPLSVDPVPAGLDYDLWLGPNSKTPYYKAYHPLTWRGFNQFGTGTFGDWFCHVADAPVWLLDLYEPVSVEAEETTGGNEFIVHDSVRVRFDFINRGTKKPCKFYWHNGPDAKPDIKEKWGLGRDLSKSGTIYKGEKTIATTNARSDAPRLLDDDQMRELNKKNIPEKYPRIKGGPVLEFVNAVKGGPKPGSNFDYSAPFTEVMLLGIIACQHGGKIEWDSKNMKITNRPELNQYLKEPAREGWEYGQDLWG